MTLALNNPQRLICHQEQKKLIQNRRETRHENQILESLYMLYSDNDFGKKNSRKTFENTTVYKVIMAI